jgi:hypothetical protein
MPIIINDFEVVVEPKPAQGGSQTAEATSSQAETSSMTLRPEDIEQIIRRFMQRHARLRAD